MSDLKVSFLVSSEMPLFIKGREVFRKVFGLLAILRDSNVFNA